MMPFKVRLFSQTPDYETLHVAKITNFPMETRDYKPYSQVRICFAPDGLHLQLIAFEVTPLPESSICAVLRFPGTLTALSLCMYCDQRINISEKIPLQSHFFTGEDLQGVFWGGNIIIPAGSLPTLMGNFSPAPGAVFMGNFYKLCTNPTRPHYGSYYPANFEQPLFIPENLGEFVVIDY